jgi:hypothetical protein
MAPPETPGARRLVSLNPAFYRTTGSRVEVRVLKISFAQSEPHERGAAVNQSVNRAMYEVFKTLDWTALGRIVER